MKYHTFYIVCLLPLEDDLLHIHRFIDILRFMWLRSLHLVVYTCGGPCPASCDCFGVPTKHHIVLRISDSTVLVLNLKLIV